MSSANQPLIDYIKAQVQGKVPPGEIKRRLLANDWKEIIVQQAFVELGIQFPDDSNDNNLALHAMPGTNSVENAFAKENITMDKIIEKFVPIVGALLLIIGFGYLIYANAWIHLTMEIRLALGFFFSVAIIGGSFSLPEKMRFFTDIGIGSGVLLLYGTLIYGSRTTDLATAMIPEVVTLLTAICFTVAVSYFASKRHSKVILILGMIGAYLTPFVIGQNDVWAANISFNAYLIYFLAVNIAVFSLGREISVRDIIPLNIAGLFIGVTTLWSLSLSISIKEVYSNNLFSGELFTAILFMTLVVFSIWSVLLSAKQFRESDDSYLSLGYIAPIIWFAFNIKGLSTVGDVAIGILYIMIAIACFSGWHFLRGAQTRYQHTALYASGLIAIFLAVVTFFQEFNIFTSILIAYASLIFAFLYMFDSQKSERFISYLVVSFTGSVLSLYHILEANLSFETVLIVIALIPAMSAFFIAKAHGGDKSQYRLLAATYSVAWSIIALIFVLAELLDYIDTNFMLFYVAPLMFLSYLAYVCVVSPDHLSHDSRSRFLQLTMCWFAFGFVAVFFTLLASIYPAPTDTFIFTNTEMPTDWIFIKGIFATAILFLGLFISRRLQLEQVIKRPSFILVIFGYSTLLLAGNYIISALANDLSIPHVDGGPRAVATTLWWVAIAIFMLYKGIKSGKKYHSEKLLGLLLLGITLIKVILYDVPNMEMQNKIIVLMLVGGAMLLFSYRVRAKNLLNTTT